MELQRPLESRRRWENCPGGASATSPSSTTISKLAGASLLVTRSRSNSAGGGHDRPRGRRVRPTRDRRLSHSELGGIGGSSGCLLHDHVSRPKDWGIGTKYKATYLGGEPGLVLLGAFVRFRHPVGIGRAATALPLRPPPPPTLNTPPDISIWYVSFPK